MPETKDRIYTALLIVVLQVVSAATLVLLGVESIPVAAIAASPAIVPGLNYRGYTGMERFEYERYKAEKSTFARIGGALIASVTAGLPGVPLGLLVFRLAPLPRQPRFVLAYLVSVGISFVVGSLVAFRLNREYLEEE